MCATSLGACSSDQDCVGLVSPGNPYLPESYCVKGSCFVCAGGICPNAFCTTDADCGNPNGLATGLVCNPATYQCGCTDSSQCSGLWPVCELNGATTLDGGLVPGPAAATPPTSAVTEDSSA